MLYPSCYLGSEEVCFCNKFVSQTNTARMGWCFFAYVVLKYNVCCCTLYLENLYPAHFMLFSCRYLLLHHLSGILI